LIILDCDELMELLADEKHKMRTDIDIKVELAKYADKLLDDEYIPEVRNNYVDLEAWRKSTVNDAVCAMCSNHSSSSITGRIARMAITVNVRIAEG
jgi:hypothetical protein